MTGTELTKEELYELNITLTYVSEHYVFHFLPGSAAERDIATIAKNQEACFSEICATLQVEYPGTIHYYFTNSPLEIGRVFWEEGTPCNGVALCGRGKIYAVYTDTVQCIGSHEDAHLISFLINYPESDFWVEGLAMSFDGLWWGVPNEVWAAYYREKHSSLSVKELLDNDSFAKWGCVVAYPIAGAFTKYLIQTYGVDRYLELYRHKGWEYEETILTVFGASLSSMEESFWKTVSMVPFDAPALEAMLRAEGF